MAVIEVVLGSFGQRFRSGPWRNADKTIRDMSGQAIVARLYQPHGLGPLPDRTGVGTPDGFIEYILASGDVNVLGEWGLRIYQSGVGENLPSVRYTIICVADE